MVRRVSRATKSDWRMGRAARGQSLAEFALVSVFLFLVLLGILEFGRFLFTYSIVTNAAQEGSRYGIARPRDVVSRTEATKMAVAGTPTYPIPTVQTVADGSCNIMDKAREKASGLDRSELNVNVWYDNGNGTPIPMNDDPTSDNYYNRVMAQGNRVVVSASYRFDFIVPFVSVFFPNGVNINMVSARTIVNNGDTAFTCAVDYTPAPTVTVAPTRTPTYTRTSTVTNTATLTKTATVTKTGTPAPTNTRTATGTATNTFTPTNTGTATNTLTPTSTFTLTSTSTRTSTPTLTNTATPTPVDRLIITAYEVYKPDGNNQPLDVYVRVTNLTGTPVTGVQVIVRAVSSVGQDYTVTLADIGGGEYRICGWQRFSGNAGDVTAYITASKPNYQSASVTTTNRSGVWCGTTPTSTATRTATRTATSTSTNTHTPTNTFTPTYTRTSTSTLTATSTRTSTSTLTPTVTNTATSTPTNYPTYTPTPVGCPYTVVVDAYKASGNTQTFVRVSVTNAFGQVVANAPVVVTIRSATRNGTTNAQGNVCLTFPRSTGSNVPGYVTVNGPVCYVLNQPFVTQSTNPHGCP